MNRRPALVSFIACFALTACFVLTACVILTACGGGGGIGSTSDASIRLVNATSDSTTLDLYESTKSVTAGVASYAASDYVDTKADTYTFNLQGGASSAVVATTSGTLDKKKHGTVVATSSGGALNASFLQDDESAPSSGTAKLRVFNAAKAEAGSVDVYLVATACSQLATSSIAATASAVEALQTTYAQLNAGSYHLCVTATGDKTDLRLDLPAFSLVDQQIVTLILTRSGGGVLLNALALNQQGTLVQALNASARMRLAAGVTGNGTVVATVNGTSIGAYASPRLGGYQLVGAGALSAAITVNGATVALAGQTIAPGADLTLLVAGPAAAPGASLIADDNTLSTSTAKPVKLRIVNGFAGASALSLDIDGNTVGGSALFGTASTPGFVAASDALSSLLVTDASGHQLYLRDGATLTAGKVYSLFLLGDAPTPPGLDTGILRIDR